MARVIRPIGDPLDNSETWEVLGHLPDTANVQARTPHGSYHFDVVGVEYDDDSDLATLVLREANGTDHHWVIVDESAWHLQHPMSCRDEGLEKCKLTRLVQVGVEAGHIVMGRSKVWLDESGAMLWGDPEPLQVIRA